MRHQELHFLNFLSALKPPLALVPRTETFWPHSACQLFCRSSNFTLRQLPGSGEAGPLAFLLCDNTQDVALCQKRGLERHCRRKGLSPCFCCGFSLSFFPAGGYPVAHTFPYCAQDRPQSSDNLTAVCPMQKPLTTDFQHFMHQYPSACTLGGLFLPRNCGPALVEGNPYIYIYTFCHSVESNHTFPMKSESKLVDKVFLSVFIPLLHTFSHP